MQTNVDKLHQYIDLKGLRHSHSREHIAKTFFESNGHISVEELLEQVRKSDPKIGLATVYRTLNLLQECGLAIKRDFDTGTVMFEPHSDEHHDHLICTNCGKIIEFLSDKIEALQDKIAQDHGFTLSMHKMELYGHCADCS